MKIRCDLDSRLINDFSSAICCIHVRRVDYEILSNARLNAKAIEKIIEKAVEKLLKRLLQRLLKELLKELLRNY